MGQSVAKTRRTCKFSSAVAKCQNDSCRKPSAIATMVNTGQVTRKSILMPPDEHQEISDTLSPMLQVHSRLSTSGRSSNASDYESLCDSMFDIASLERSNEKTTKLNDILPTREECKELQIIFESIKVNAELIAWKGVEKMFKNIPDVSSRYKASPNRPIRKGESWELMGQGIVLLRALESAMHMARKPRQFRKFVTKLVKNHEKYGVPIEELAMALDIFHSLIASYIFEKMSCNRYRDSCYVLNKFFTSLHFELQQLEATKRGDVLISTNSNIRPRSHSQNDLERKRKSQ